MRSDITFSLFIGILAISIIIPIIVCSAYAANSNLSRLAYACVPQGQVARCHPSSNKFDSLVTTGQVQRVSTVNLTKIDPTEGVVGNALAINGYRQSYLTLDNKPEIDSKAFSISFWFKQDPGYVANSAIISHGIATVICTKSLKP